MSNMALRRACGSLLSSMVLGPYTIGLTVLGVACAPPAPAVQPETPQPAKPKPLCGTERDCKTSPAFTSVQRAAQDRLIAEALPGGNFSRASCEDELYIEKWDAAKGWVRLEELPPSQEGRRLYIGDHFVSTGGNEGCDVRGCNVLQGKINLGELAEYVKVGTRAAPKRSASDSELADVYERRVVTAPVRGSLLISPGGSCAAPERMFAVP